MKRISILMILIAAFTNAYSQSTWSIDNSHSSIGFTVSHMVISETEGNFKDFTASVVSKNEDFSGAEVTFTAKVASIDTDNEQRDEHLKSADFFNAEKYPEITFKGKLEKKGSKYQLTGDFTMHGVTKKATFAVKYNGTIKDPYGNTKAGFKLTGTVDRTAYGLSWNALTEAGGAVVGEEVEITCNIELQKKA